MRYYLLIAGVKGDSTADGHVGQFEIDSFQFGMARGATKPQPTALIASPFGFTLSSPFFLARIAALAKTGSAFSMTLFGSVGNATFDSLKIVLKDAQIADMSFADAGGGDRPQLTCSVAFSALTYTFTPPDDRGNPDTANMVTATYKFA